MEQLTLFDVDTTGLVCCHCLKDPGWKGSYPIWNGFKDKDTGQHVGCCCKERHYYEKWKGEHRGKYSEFPVVLTKYYII